MTEGLRKGDEVVMTNCGEAEHYEGKVWTCRSDQFKSHNGRDPEDVVFLEGFSGFFCCECLTKKSELAEVKRKAESKEYRKLVRDLRGM